MYGDLEVYDELWYSIEPKPWFLDPEYGDYDSDEDEEWFPDECKWSMGKNRRTVSIRVRYPSGSRK